MKLGLDVGGTHTDAVLIKDGVIISTAKIRTNHEDLFSSVYEAIATVTENSPREDISRINLSTTLSTNAIVEDRIEPTGLIVSAGPGVNADNYRLGNNYYIVNGSIDHRGTVILDLDKEELNQAVSASVKEGIKVFALVTKFSTRNAEQEFLMEEHAKEHADYVTLGHQVSGVLSFPRRLATAYFNSAVWRTYNKFADAIEKGLEGLGISADIHFLKADGGTMPLQRSRMFPVESILSGPAASVMGIAGLCSISEDSVILDIGGTTTDIAVFAEGVPLVVRDGISIGGSPTLVRALNSLSIGVGGDSAIFIDQGKLKVGPERHGEPLASGGTVPALMDALNVMGKTSYMDDDASTRGMERLAGELGIGTEECAKEAVRIAIGHIVQSVEDFVEQINDKPVYTIHEMLTGKKIELKKVYVVGGPAYALQGLLEEEFSLPVVVPEHSNVANAIGAAIARTTFDIELFADTAKGVLIVPILDINETIDQSYTLEKAKEDAVEFMKKKMHQLGLKGDSGNIEIVQTSVFKMTGGFFNRGMDIRVKCQVKPSVSGLKEGRVHA